MPSVRCSLCRKNHLCGSGSSSSELVQLTPALSVHSLCLRAASGLAARRECSSHEILAEVDRCLEIKCDFCQKPGASAVCSNDTCGRTFHLPCFLLAKNCSLKKPGRKRKRKKKSLMEKLWCDKHLCKLKGTSSPTIRRKTPRPVRRRRNAPRTRQGSRRATKSKGQKRVPVAQVKEENEVCSVELCTCPFGRDFLSDQGLWAVTVCLRCSKASGHAECVGEDSQEFVCPPCLKNTQDVKEEKFLVGRNNQEAVSEKAAVVKSERKMQRHGALSLMKFSFCKDIDLHLHSKKRKERSPLSLKQKESSKAPGKAVKQSDQVVVGKENKQTTKLRKRTHHKWTLSNDENVPQKKKRKKKKKKKQSQVNTKNDSLKSFPTLPPPGPSSPAKKFVEESNSSPLEHKNGTRKKKPSSYSNSGIKTRQIFHVRNTLPIEHDEEEAEEDYQWLVDNSDRQVDDFLDLNDGEKEFFKLWNAHLHRHPCFGDKMMYWVLLLFVEEHGDAIIQKNLYNNFMLHLTNFYDFAVLDQKTVLEVALLLRAKLYDHRCRERQNVLKVAAAVDEETEEDDNLTLYLSESDDEMILKKRSRSSCKKGKVKVRSSPPLVYYACDGSTSVILDHKLVSTGRCRRGTRFGAFASPVHYVGRRWRRLRRNTASHTRK